MITRLSMQPQGGVARLMGNDGTHRTPVGGDAILFEACIGS